MAQTQNAQHVLVDSKISQWGNSLGLRVSGIIKDMPAFEKDTPVEIEVFADGFRVTKKQPTKPNLLGETELLASLNEHTAHADALAETSSNEWLD